MQLLLDYITKKLFTHDLVLVIVKLEISCTVHLNLEMVLYYSALSGLQSALKPLYNFRLKIQLL